MSDFEDIIDTLIAEGYAEGPEGMRRIAETILNRGAIRGQSFGDVVRAPAQYTGFSNPGPAAIKAQQDPKARKAAEDAWVLALEPGDPTGGADHYHADYVDPDWASRLPTTGSYKNHVFYKSRPIPPAALNNAVATQMDVVPSRARVAPAPRSAPVRGTVPSDLIAASFANNASTQSRSRAAALSGPAVNSSTPRLTNAGTVASPASISTDWANDIFPNTARRSTPIIAQPSLTRPSAVNDVHSALTQDSALQAALRQNINSGGQSVASSPTRTSSISASDLTRGRSGISTVAVIPTTGVGRPPATRVVQSVPVSGRDPVQSMPQFSEIATMFGRPSSTASAAIDRAFGPSGTTNNNKAQDRLPATAGQNAYAPGPDLFGGLNPASIRAPGVPRPAAQAQVARDPTPRYRTETYQVEHPEWVTAQASPVPAGIPVNFGSRDTVAQRAAGAITAANIPRYLTRTRQVAITTPAAAVARAAAPVPFTRPAPVPVQRPVAAPARPPLEVTVQGANIVQPPKSGGTSAVQRLRDKGYSPSQAYNMANKQASDRARAGASNPVSSFHERATSSGGMWSAHD